MTVKAINALARGESEPEILEYLKYNSDRGQMRYTWRLGHHYYAGSVFPHGSGGVSSGAEEIGEIPQSFDEARRYFHKVARQMWPVDYDAEGKPGLKRQMSDERRKELNDPAMVAAAFLGRMYLRGEGMKQDFKLSRLWFGRAAALGDREAHNGLGVIYRDGLGVKKDLEKAFKYFQTAAGLELPDAEINIGKMLLERGDKVRATQYFIHAVQHGSPFEAFYHLAGLQSIIARTPMEEGGTPGSCGVAVGYYKLVSELGAWDDDYVGEANRAWGRGEEDKALLGWWIASETGSEIGQNNVAFMLNRGSAAFGQTVPADTELMLWTRSAAQGNADAMVMVGDSYCELRRITWADLRHWRKRQLDGRSQRNGAHGARDARLHPCTRLLPDSGREAQPHGILEPGVHVRERAGRRARLASREAQLRSCAVREPRRRVFAVGLEPCQAVYPEVSSSWRRRAVFRLVVSSLRPSGSC